MKQIKVALLVALCTMISANAVAITKTAREKAQRFLKLEASQSLEHVALPAELSKNVEAYNVSGAKGFVILADDSQGNSQVVAYSKEGEIDYTNMPEAMKYMLMVISQSMKSGAEQDEEDVVCRKSETALANEVSPLLGDIAWGQDYPFNERCPISKTTGKHLYVGCVATAATQIMRYYKFPNSYDWENMPAVAPTANASLKQINAYSSLAADFGEAVNMEYLENGSAASSMMVAGALRGFGYQNNARVHRRNYYSTNEWINLMKVELTARRPVYYGASSDVSNSGHAFVLDGYDTNGYFHINWGWYGTSNGYFMLNHFDPSALGIGGGTGGYNRDQEIVTGISSTPIILQQEWPIYGSARLTCNNYTTEATFMTIIENFETDAFEGQVAVVVMRGTEVLKVLHQEALAVAGFKNNMSGYITLWLRNVPIGNVEAADGECQVRLATRLNGETEWTPLRHGKGYPSYVKATIANNKLSLGSTNVPSPNVKLTAEPKLNGPVFEGGAVSMTVALKNMSADYMLKNIVVRMTDANDASKHFDAENEVNIYDESAEIVTLVFGVPLGVTKGTYNVTFFEKGFEELPFDDSEVGTLALTVQENPGHAVLRLTQPTVWSTLSGADEITQGDGISFATEVRNYGPEGTMAMQCWLKSKTDPTKMFIFNEQSVTAKAGEKKTVIFYRKMVLDPGEYTFEYRYETADGTTEVDDTEYTVGVAEVKAPTEPLALEVVDMQMPTKMIIGERYACSVTLKAVGANYAGTVYVRLRQFTNTKGEIATMGSQSIVAGNTKTITFNYRPAVEAHKYMLVIDYKNGTQSDLVPAGCDNYFRVIEVSTKSGINDVESDSAELDETKPFYNLNGQKVNKDTKGLILQKGKKVLVK